MGDDVQIFFEKFLNQDMYELTSLRYIRAEKNLMKHTPVRLREERFSACAVV